MRTPLVSGKHGQAHNAAIYSPSGASAGIGFAVPVDTVNRVVPQLIQQGKYIRPTLGVETDDRLNERLTNLLGIEGVVVLGVPPGSAAAKIGLRGVSVTRSDDVILGDVVAAINGKKVDGVGKLLAMLDDFRIGEAVRLTVVRQGRAREVVVNLQAGD